MPVLITAGMSAEAYRLERILKEAGNEKWETRAVVFADDSPLPQVPGRESLVLPPYNSASFVHETLKACLDLGIGRLYPLKWGEVRELAKARELFAEYQVTLMIPSDEWIKSNKEIGCQRGENVCVMDNGQVVAGIALPDENLLINETGVFTWATKSDKIEYCLYLVEDAGI